MSEKKTEFVERPSTVDKALHLCIALKYG